MDYYTGDDPQDDEKRLEAMIAQIDARLDHRHFEKALALVKEADHDFPHNPEIMKRYSICLNGLRIISFTTIDEIKKEPTNVSDLHFEWDTEPIVKAPKERVRNLYLPALLWDPDAVVASSVPPPINPYRRYASILAHVVTIFLVTYLPLSMLFSLIAGPQPGEVHTFADIDFVWIPPADSTRSDAKASEQPYLLSTGFWMSRFEVSRENWGQFSGREPTTQKRGKSRYPVSNVDFDSCQRFVSWLNRSRTGIYAIPTEAVWEWAASAGDTRTAALAPDYKTRTFLIWHADNSDMRIHPVGTKAPNAWGLHDMLGNVEEWTATPSEDFADDGIQHAENSYILKGGSALTLPDDCTVRARDTLRGDVPDPVVGLRLVRFPTTLLTLAMQSNYSNPVPEPAVSKFAIRRPQRNRSVADQPGTTEATAQTEAVDSPQRSQRSLQYRGVLGQLERILLTEG